MNIFYIFHIWLSSVVYVILKDSQCIFTVSPICGHVTMNILKVSSILSSVALYFATKFNRISYCITLATNTHADRMK
jgi:hypothetical protein